MACVAVDHSYIVGNNPISGHRFTFRSSPLLRAQLGQLQSRQMNKPTFQLKPLGAALRLQTTQKKQVSTIQRNIHKQSYNSLTDTPTEQAIFQSQSTSHTGAHLMQPRSEAYEVEDLCFRVSFATISFSCLLTLSLRPLCSRACLSEIDVLHIALGCRFALDIFTISQQLSPTPDHEPLPHDPEFATL